MGSAFPFDEDLPFEEKVKCFEDEELLEIWAESQEMECMMDLNEPVETEGGACFEQVIVQELNLRLGKKIARSPRRGAPL